MILTEKKEAGLEIASTLGEKEFKNAKALKADAVKGFIESENYVLSWAMGHLFTQPFPEHIDPKFKLGVVLASPQEYRMESMAFNIPSVPSDDKYKKRQIKTLNSLLKRTDINEIYLAPDGDAEGEAIGRDMLKINKKSLSKKIYRLWITGAFSSKIGVSKAIQDKLPYNDPKYIALYHSQLARSICDYILGMKLTKVCVETYNKHFFIGRVKGVITALIGNRVHEYKNHVPTPFWTLSGFAGDLELTHYYAKEYSITKADGTIEKKSKKETVYLDEAMYNNMVESLNRDRLTFSVKKLTKEVSVSNKRPLPLSGDDFASEMMSKYKIEYEEADAILDYLRNNGFTTYPGTNGRYFARNDAAMVKEALSIANTYFDKSAVFSLDAQLFDDVKAPEQNHPPLHLKENIPTSADIEKWESATFVDDKKVTRPLPRIKEGYELIAKRIIASFLEDDKIEKQHLVIESPGGYFFELTGRKALDQGWRTLLDKEIKDSTFKSDNLSVGDTFKLNSLKKHEGKTEAPGLYTVASLLDTLMNVSKEIDKLLKVAKTPQTIARLKKTKKLLNNSEGIGTKRTRKAIILELIENGTIKLDAKKKLILTEMGEELYIVYPRLLKSVEVTGSWENALEKIRQGKLDYKVFIKSVDKMLMDRMIPEIINNAGSKVSVKVKKPTSPKVVLAGASCPICQSNVTENHDYYTCEKQVYSGGKVSGCKFSVRKGIKKILGRDLDGIDDFNAFIASTKDAPLKEFSHSVYFEPKEKGCMKIIWKPKGIGGGSGGRSRRPKMKIS